MDTIIKLNQNEKYGVKFKKMVLTTRTPEPPYRMAGGMREGGEVSGTVCIHFFGALCIMPADGQWNLSPYANKSNKFIKSYLHEWEIHVHINYAPETIWKVNHHVWHVLLKYCMCWTVKSFKTSMSTFHKMDKTSPQATSCQYGVNFQHLWDCFYLHY
jgi:hypothetical protein